MLAVFCGKQDLGTNPRCLQVKKCDVKESNGDAVVMDGVERAPDSLQG